MPFKLFRFLKGIWEFALFVRTLCFANGQREGWLHIYLSDLSMLNQIRKL